MNKYIVFVTLLLGLVLFTSCSSDDEPATKTGDEQVAHLCSYLLDDEGKIVYFESSTQGVYILPIASENAHLLTEAILDDAWNGASQTYKLVDDKGFIKIAKAPKEGVYVTLSFDVSTIPPFTLEIASEEYFQSDNAVIHRPTDGCFAWKCNDCGKIMLHGGMVHGFVCNKCGCTRFTRL